MGRGGGVNVKSIASPAIGLVSSLLLLSAVGGPALAADKLAVGLSSTDALYGPWFYAQEKGFFAKHGFDVTLTFLESGTRCVQALVGGSIDVCAADGSALVNAVFAGAEIAYIGTTFNVVAGDIYGNKSVTSPAMIRHGKWAISSFGAESHMVARVTLKSFNISENEVTIVQIGNQNNRLAALESGQVQATSLAPPANFRAAAMGLPRLAKLSDLGLEYLSVGPAVSRKYIQQQRAAVKRFLEAMGEATAAYKKDRAGSVQVLQKWLKITDSKQAEDTWEYFAPYHDVNLKLTPKSFEIPLRFSDNPKAANAKPADFSDLSVLDELEKEGFFKKLN
jgi:NitT/TauT family transport system substrate-binding protein